MKIPELTSLTRSLSGLSNTVVVLRIPAEMQINTVNMWNIISVREIFTFAHIRGQVEHSDDRLRHSAADIG